MDNDKRVQDPLPEQTIQRKSSLNCVLKCCIITGIVILVLLVLAFLIIFVALPVAFRYSPELQRDLIFVTDRQFAAKINYSNFKSYGFEGVRNLYHTVNENITLGLWHIVPEELKNASMQKDFNYTASLQYSRYPIVLYFHGNARKRVDAINMYKVLRKFFHVIAFDYRGYADSSLVKPTEVGIVEDSVQLYKWIRSQTDVGIYLWGHSLGAALSAFTVARLRDENIIPRGLFLEAPFSNLVDFVELLEEPKMFSWMPWYKLVVVDSLKDNGFSFETMTNILRVDCPIMIIHAMDDPIIPYELAQKLFNVAQEFRDPTTQGSVTFHLLPYDQFCQHMSIYKATNLKQYIKDHIKICHEYHDRNN